jgi:exodeoxyribonuclease VII small subunit
MNTPPPKRSPKKPDASQANATSGMPADEVLTFEAALAALEGVVQQLEQGELGLSDSLACYEQGVRYLKQCYGQLAAAERRIELLKQVDPEGRAETASFDEQAMSLEEKAAARGARRRADPAPRRNPRAEDGGAVDDSGGLF